MPVASMCRVYARRCSVSASGLCWVTFYVYNSPSSKPAQIVANLVITCFLDARSAVDLTPGRDNFWKGWSPPFEVARSQHDFRSLPYDDASFDLVVYDPPHNADAGKRSIMRKRFDTYPNSELREVMIQGAREAWRVARIGTIIKVTDQVHDTVFQHQSGWIVEALGTPYQIVHGTRTRAIEFRKWRIRGCQISPYSNGSVYLVHRHGDQRHVRRNAQHPTAESAPCHKRATTIRLGSTSE